MMQQIHQDFKKQYSWYRNWHQYPFHAHIHWVAFLILALASTSMLITRINQLVNVEFNTGQAASSVSLSIAPNTTALQLGQTVDVPVLINTSGSSVDAIDLNSLHYNPSVLQVQDDDTATAGTQITPGSLFAATLINKVDTTAGTITFSQSGSGGESFNGSGTLATVHFKALSNGTSALTLDYRTDSTTDTNTAFGGSDILATVNNSSLTVGATLPPLTVVSKGHTRDLIAPLENSTPDGRNDVEFSVTLSGSKTITKVVLTGRGTWDTVPGNGVWFLGVTPNSTSALVNSASANLNFAGSSFNLYAAEDEHPRFTPGTDITVTATFSDGTTASGSTKTQ